MLVECLNEVAIKMDLINLVEYNAWSSQESVGANGLGCVLSDWHNYMDEEKFILSISLCLFKQIKRRLWIIDKLTFFSGFMLLHTIKFSGFHKSVLAEPSTFHTWSNLHEKCNTLSSQYGA